jgi:hypothetical protein
VITFTRTVKNYYVPKPGGKVFPLTPQGEETRLAVAFDGSDPLLAILDDAESGMSLIRRICELCVSELAVSGAGVSVMGGRSADSSQALVHTTGSTSARLEDLQLTLGEGPSIEAYNSSGPVLIPDLTVEHRRWPAFAPGAAGLGVAAVFSFPLQIGAARMGVLDLHRETPGPLTAFRLRKAFKLAESTVVALLDDVEFPPAATLPWLGDVHNGVHQATGMVTVQLGVGIHEALLRIRAYAYAHQLSLNEVGRQIVARELHLKMEE